MCQDANPHVGDRIQPYGSDDESLVSHNFISNRGKDREIWNCANGFLEEVTGDFGLESKAGKKKKKKSKEGILGRGIAKVWGPERKHV